MKRKIKWHREEANFKDRANQTCTRNARGNNLNSKDRLICKVQLSVRIF